jgi:hypothetical protein
MIMALGAEVCTSGLALIGTSGRVRNEPLPNRWLIAGLRSRTAS